MIRGRRDDAGAWQPSSEMRVLIERVIVQFDCTPEEFYGPRRFDRIVRARMAAVWVLRRQWKLTWVCVARAIGREARDTVKHLDARAQYWRNRDSYFAQVTDALLADAPPPRRQLVPSGPVPAEEDVVVQSVRPRNRIVEGDHDGMARFHGTRALVAAIAASGGRFR